MTSANPDLRVLVTGGAGFLGSAILRELARAPFAEVRVFDLKEPDPKDLPGVVSLVGDIRDADAVREACRGTDVVIHAASASIPASSRRPMRASTRLRAVVAK